MSEIKKCLALIKGRDINSSDLIASAEWLGKEFEEEIDLARRDREEEQREDGDDENRGQ